MTPFIDGATHASKTSLSQLDLSLLQNGSKEPKWNKTINCFLMVCSGDNFRVSFEHDLSKVGARSIDVEIYDECTFSPDALVAHTSVPITDSLMTKGEMVDDWWPLSGQEGEEKEGLLHLILSVQVTICFRIPGSIL